MKIKQILWKYFKKGSCSKIAVELDVSEVWKKLEEKNLK